MLENIIFCLCWMSGEFNSEDICTAIRHRFQDDRLEPHDIDIIGGQILLHEEGTSIIIREFIDLSEEMEHQRKASFWEHLEKAQQAEKKLVYNLQIRGC